MSKINVTLRGNVLTLQVLKAQYPWRTHVKTMAVDALMPCIDMPSPNPSAVMVMTANLHLEPILLTWNNFNHSMDKWSQPLSMEDEITNSCPNVSSEASEV